ncbi:hypothetical protein U1Q18_033758, partial [Sarracenia purpurea var. burkii]
MDVFTGGRKIPDDIDFPIHLTPFPESADILCNDRTAEIRPPEIEHRSIPPLQKLRPIRCNGRPLPDFTDSSMAETAGLEETLLGCHGELGFLSQFSPQKLGLVNEGSEECTNASMDLTSVSTPENCGSGFADNPRSVVDVPALQQIKMEINAECMNLISEAHVFETGLSSSSDDDCDLLETVTEPLSRKRKRKTRKNLKLFVENMLRNVMEKQEQMHKQLIEMIEMRERERIIREEAWKQQEIERAKKDEEARAQEKSRTLALISCIQNLVGHEIQIPCSWEEASCLEKDEGEIHDQKDLRCYDSYHMRWSKSEVQALITLRTALDHKFLKGPKGTAWEE